MDNNNYAEWWCIAPEELKNQFEASPFIKPAIKKSLVGTGGEWIDDTWHYFDAELNIRFATFCEGFIQGAIAMVTQEDEKIEERLRNDSMNKQLSEKDEDDLFTVVDITKYKDIK